MLAPVILPERVTVSATLPLVALVDADDVIERAVSCGPTVTYTVAVGLLIVVPLDGLDRVTVKIRFLLCVLLVFVRKGIVLDVSPAANVSVPEVAL